MLDDIRELLDKLDIQKAREVVDTLWVDREKIIDVVAMVWENRDRIDGVIEFVREHGDDLLDLLDKVPDVLSSAGDGIATAGASAVTASNMLTGNDGGFDAKDLTESAGGAIDRCHEQLEMVTNMLADLGDEIDDIKIPTVRPKMREVMGRRLVTGVDVGELPLTDQAAGRLRDGSKRVQSVAADLKVVSGHIGTLGEALGRTGKDLHGVGSRLTSSGTTLVDVSAKMAGGVGVPTRERTAVKKAKSPLKKGGPKRRSAQGSVAAAAAKTRESARKSAAKKKPTTKKPTRKKAAPKKPAAKKPTPKKKSSTKKKGMPAGPKV